jgi:hypothetical protein
MHTIADWPVDEVAVPGESRVSHFYQKTDLADAFAIRLPDDAISDPEALARFVLLHQAPWVGWLMKLRDAMVAGFGLKTSAELQRAKGPGDVKRLHFFRIYETSTNEIVLGEDDKHLDFRLSVLRQMRAVPNGAAPHLVMTTVVSCHNLLGHAYLTLIAPFHRQVMRSSLRGAARAGWPRVA